MSRTPREEEAARGLVLLQEVGAKRSRPDAEEPLSSKRSMPPELKTLSLDIDLTMSLDTPNVQRFKLLASGYAQQIGSFVTPFFADKRPDLENPFEPREESSVYESTHLLLHPSIDKVKRMISVPLYVPYPLIPSFSSYRAVKEADSNECKLQWTRGKRSIECESLGIRLGALGSNLPMEDDMVVACLESIDSLLVAVLDGHGGRQVVDYVHYLFPRLLKDRLMGWLSPSGEALLASLDQRPFSFRNKTDIAAIMVGTLLEIESRLLHSIQKKQTPLSGASFESKNAANYGTCLTACLVQEKRIVTASLGDCRACIVSKDRHVFVLNEEHSPLNPSELKRVESMTRGRDAIPVRPSLAYMVSYKMRHGHTGQDAQTIVVGALTKAMQTTELDPMNVLAVESGISRDVLYSMVPRAGGILAMTRSLGDMQLKTPSEAHPFNAPRVPYISSIPDINVWERSDRDDYLIVASDGLWSFFTTEDVVVLVEEYRESFDLELKRLPEFLINKVLAKAAETSKMTVEQLMAIPYGDSRRKVHDDISIIVVLLAQQ